MFKKENSRREQHLKFNHRHGSRKKEFNKNTDISGSGTPKATFQCHQPKLITVHLNDRHEYINTRDNNNEPTHPVNAT